MYFLQLDFVDKTCQQLGLLFCLDWNTWVLDYVDIVGACTNHLSVCMTLTYYETKGNFFSKFLNNRNIFYNKNFCLWYQDFTDTLPHLHFLVSEKVSQYNVWFFWIWRNFIGPWSVYLVRWTQSSRYMFHLLGLLFSLFI